MAAASPFKPQNHSGPIQGSQSCSVCLEPVSDGGERSMAKLKCGHHFHLDCIGSAFNVKGTMQCPNCRHVEDGQWLYANGCQQHEDLTLEDIIYEDSFDIYAGVSESFFPHEEMHFGHLQWCPYRSYPQFSLSFEEAGHPPGGYADLIVNVLIGDHGNNLNSLHPCPFIQSQGRLLRHFPPHEEGAVMLDIPSGSQHVSPIVAGTTPRQAPFHQGGRWIQHSPTHMSGLSSFGSHEYGMLASMHPLNRSRWTHPDADRFSGAGTSFPSHFGHSSVQRSGDIVLGSVDMRNTLPHGQNHSMPELSGGSQPPPQFGHFSATSSHSRRPRIRALSQTARLRPTHPPEGMVMQGMTNWGTVVTTAGHDSSLGRVESAGHNDGLGLAPWRRDGASVIPLFPLEPDARRWMPPPPPANYHSDEAYGSDLSMQANLRLPEGVLGNQFQGPFAAFPPTTFFPDSQADMGSLQTPPSSHPSR
eukprot:c25969_g1_i2 orf=546-1964(+)